MAVTDHDVERTHDVRWSANRRAWSPAQVLAGAIGLAYVVLGGIALARTGFSDLTGVTATVAGFEHTALLGLIEMAYGVLLLAAATTPDGARETLVFLGVVALAVGIIIAVEPAAFSETLGAGTETGWLYAATGTLSLVGGFFSPTIFTRTTYRRDRDASVIR